MKKTQYFSRFFITVLFHSAYTNKTKRETFFTMKILNKGELQQIALNHSDEIEFKACVPYFLSNFYFFSK